MGPVVTVPGQAEIPKLLTLILQIFICPENVVSFYDYCNIQVHFRLNHDQTPWEQSDLSPLFRLHNVLLRTFVCLIQNDHEKNSCMFKTDPCLK